MKVLATAAQINEEMVELLGKCYTCQIGVAWATINCGALTALLKNCQKIEKMVVGMHFYQTDPDFIECFLQNKNVRFVLAADGVFHPKVYHFESAQGKWECIVGSPNFTKGGLETNTEMAVLITDEDRQSPETLCSIKAAMQSYWERASPLSSEQVSDYRDAWDRKRMALKDLTDEPIKQEKAIRSEHRLDAENLFRFAHSLEGKTLLTLTQRKPFTLEVTSSSLEIVSGKGVEPKLIAFEMVQWFCGEYRRLNKSKMPSKYTKKCGTSSYLVTLVDHFEQEYGQT